MSLVSRSSSNETSLIPSIFFGVLLDAITFISKAFAIFATAFPMFPSPTMPSVLPASSFSGYTNGEKVLLLFHLPS